RGGQPCARFLLVHVARVEREHVNLLPRDRQERGRRRRVESRALGDDDATAGIPHVVAHDAIDEDVRCGHLAPEGDRLHAGRDFWLIGTPVPPPRTAWISARTASAISGAALAPRSRPMGTRTRARLASSTPSSRSSL